MTAIVRTRCSFILKPSVKKTELQSQTGAEVTAAVLKRHACQHPTTRLLSSLPGPCDCHPQGSRSHMGRPPCLYSPVPRAGASALMSTRPNGTEKKIHGKFTTQLGCPLLQQAVPDSPCLSCHPGCIRGLFWALELLSPPPRGHLSLSPGSLNLAVPGTGRPPFDSHPPLKHT